MGPFSTSIFRQGVGPNSTRITIQLPICTARDERLLEELLQRDFGGFTSGPSFVRGIGLRGIQFETNIHRQITVLASRSRATRHYIQALRRELEQSSGEEQILILRQDLAIV